MSVSRKALRRKSMGFRHIGAAFAGFGLLISGCRSVGDPGNAPAVGTFAGVGAGALIGSVSGSAGTGAVIGGMLGRSGGELVRHDRSPARVADDALRLRDLSTTLRAAARFDATLKKAHDSLARRRATSPALETLPVKAEAKQKLAEIASWIHLMEASDDALARAVSNATAYPSANLGTWLNQRNQVRSRLASLRMHQSWFKALAS